MDKNEFKDKIEVIKSEGLDYFVVETNDSQICANKYEFGNETVKLWYIKNKRCEWYIGNLKLDSVKDVYPLIIREFIV